MSLYHGQKLVCKNGEEVTVINIINDILTVEYKGKHHKRHISIIGEKLFIKDADIVNQQGTIDNIKITEKPKLSSYSSGNIPSETMLPNSNIPKHWPKRMKG
ncbi:MAG: hypothetical protein SCJ94_10570, partial [Bacillota bacterium]|nr:hypothetical protein [Bacillota bacterium]